MRSAGHNGDGAGVAARSGQVCASGFESRAVHGAIVACAYDRAVSELHRFLFDGLPVRGILVRLTDSWREMLARRGDGDNALPAPVQRLLGEMTAAGVLMHANIKFGGDLVLQVFGDGPVKLAVAEIAADLAFRATATVVGEVGPDAGLEAMLNAHGGGRCAITLAPTSRTPGHAAVPGRRAAARRCARAAAGDRAGARALHAAVGAARHAARARGRRPGRRRPAAAAPAAAGRRCRRDADRARRGFQPRRHAGRDADPRRAADARCRHAPAPSLLGREGHALPAARRRARRRASPAPARGRASARC